MKLFKVFALLFLGLLPPAVIAQGTVVYTSNPVIVYGIKYQGAYSPSTTYALNDFVTSGSNSYISLTNGNVGNTPASSPTFWAPVTINTSGTITAGAQYKIPCYTSPGTVAAVGPCNTTTDSTGNQLNSPIANGTYEAFSNQAGAGNNGIANAFGAGALWVDVGPNYANTEGRVFGPAGTRIEDRRKGHLIVGCSDPSVADDQAYCEVDNFISVNRRTANVSEGSAQNIHNTFIGGIGNSDDAGGALFGGQGSNDGTMWDFANGIGSTISTALLCAHDEDCILKYRYLYYMGDCHALGKECNKWSAIDTYEFPYVAETTIGSIIDQTHLRLASVDHGHTPNGGQIGGGTVLRRTVTVDSGNATGTFDASASNMPRYFSTDAPHASLVTTSYALTTPNGALPAPMNVGWFPQAANVPLGTAVTVTVTNQAAGFPVVSSWSSSTTYSAWSSSAGYTNSNTVTYLNSTYISTTNSNLNNPPIVGTVINANWKPLDVCIAGPFHWEEAPFIASTATGSTQNLLITNRYSNPGISFVALGSCRIVQLTMEKQTDSSGKTRSYPYYIIVGSSDSTHYWYTPTTGIYSDKILTGVETPAAYYAPVATVSVTRNGTKASAVVSGSVAGLGYFDGAASMTVASCIDATYDFTNANLSPHVVGQNGIAPDQIVITWNDTGTAGSTTGCTIQVTGRSAFVIYDAAEVVSATDPSVAVPNSTDPNQMPLPVNGYMQLAYNDVAWTAGDNVQQPHGPRLTASATEAHTQNTPCGFGCGATAAYSGQGFTGPNFVAHHDIWYDINGTGGAIQSPTNFQGYGGGWPVGQNYWEMDGGMFNTFFSFGFAPANSGSVFQIGCPPDGCNSTRRYAFASLLGNGGSTIYYNPNANTIEFSTNRLISDSPINAPSYHTTISDRTAQYFFTDGLGGLDAFKVGATSTNSGGVSHNSGTPTSPTWNPGWWTAQQITINPNGCFGYAATQMTGDFYDPTMDTEICRNATAGAVKIIQGSGAWGSVSTGDFIVQNSLTNKNASHPWYMFDDGSTNQMGFYDALGYNLQVFSGATGHIQFGAATYGVPGTLATLWGAFDVTGMCVGTACQGKVSNLGVGTFASGTTVNGHLLCDSTGANCPSFVPPITGTTASIGGSPLAVGACSAGTVTIAGGTAGHTAGVSTSDGTDVGGGFYYRAVTTNSTTVTVSVCAAVAGTPPAKTYNISTY